MQEAAPPPHTHLPLLDLIPQMSELLQVESARPVHLAEAVKVNAGKAGCAADISDHTLNRDKTEVSGGGGWGGPSQTLAGGVGSCGSSRTQSQNTDTKDTSIRAIMLLQLSRLKPTVFRSLPGGVEGGQKPQTSHIKHGGGVLMMRAVRKAFVYLQVRGGGGVKATARETHAQ